MMTRNNFKKDLEIFLDPRFSEFSCATCTSKEKLLRGCKRTDYKGPEAIGKILFRFDDYTVDYCPLSHVDWRILGDSLDAEHYFTNGFLPDEGTIIDQTEFFCESSKLVTQAKAKAEAKYYEDQKQSK